MKKLILSIITLCSLVSITMADAPVGISKSQKKREMIQASIEAYPGNCPCPYTVDKTGRRCGRRSAYSKRGGYALLCYESDITDDMPPTKVTSSNTKKDSKAVYPIITGKVIKVADGDTITILDATNTQNKIRLYGIDAPEKAQDFGNKSREKLASLVAGKDIAVTVMDIDRYGRNVGRINIEGKEVAEEMLKAGMVWLYTAYCKIPECKHWKELETQAKTAKIGLWSNPTAKEPWLWRREHK